MNLFNHALLKECRLRQGLTQLEAANRIGIARTTYADYEKGKIQPPIDKLQRISIWLDVPTSELMQVKNDTGIDLNTLDLWKKSEIEKLQIVNRIQTKEAIFNTFDEFADKIRKLGLTKDEKDLIINLLDYIYMNNYQFTPQECEYREKMQEQNND